MDEEQQPDREPPVATTSYHTDPHLTEQAKRAEEERAESEQDTAETDEGGE